ncbi:MAG: hypothetical protein FVQ83_12760 [Chloroflexi bacterium]|nr:hypothetical protein [Chloroflexota bacterium]
MNTKIRELITDLKGAARIGHPETIQTALDGVRALPQVSGNRPMQANFLSQAILPMAQALAHPRLQAAHLRPLAKDPLAGLRALAGAVFGLRYFRQSGITLEDLRHLGNDTRIEVRDALVLGLAEGSQEQRQLLFELVNVWIGADSPRLQQVAIKLLPSLLNTHSSPVLDMLPPLTKSSDPDVRAALVNSLITIAQADLADQILELLSSWANKAQPNIWVIARTLSGSWASKRAEKALNILRTLASHIGPNKQISNALQALERHGAEKAVRSALIKWGQDASSNLQAFVKIT